MSSSNASGSRSRGTGRGGGAGEAAGGGFLPSLPSPPPSSAASSASALPTPRTHPLRPGSAKESSTRQWVESALLRISGRYERRFARRLAAAAQAQSQSQGAPSTPSSNQQNDADGDDVRGYASYAEAAVDLGNVLDVLWVSGTPTLQIPFLLSLALAASDYLPAFPFAPLATFTLLHKLDAAFAALLAGDAAAAGRPLTMTEKVRLRGIIEGTRTRVARQASDEWEDIGEGDGDRANSTVGPGTATDTETETEGEREDWDGGGGGDETVDTWEVEVARVYERTIVELGMLLDAQATMGGES